ncbi:MAG TPA: hypothetical protein PLU41_16290, partial [Acidobacteriota bacterium]|nr:hypothetical protein [Acidobacteriota bacterium]
NYRNHFKNVAPLQLGNIKEKVGNSTDFMTDRLVQRNDGVRPSGCAGPISSRHIGGFADRFDWLLPSGRSRMKINRTRRNDLKLPEIPSGCFRIPNRRKSVMIAEHTLWMRIVWNR